MNSLMIAEGRVTELQGDAANDNDCPNTRTSALWHVLRIAILMLIHATTPKDRDTQFLIGLGVGFNFTFGSRIVLQILPLFQADPDNKNSQFGSLQGRFGMRF